MIRKDWVEGKLEDLLNYIQPTNYIVDSTAYDDSYKTPVLTAGKTFILGYTNEEENIFSDLPVIIFDDFTTATKYVNFKFKVKSSAMKILVPTSDQVDMKYVYYFMQTIRHNVDTHKRYWISIFSKLNIKIAPLLEQRAIVAKIEELFSGLDSGIASLQNAKNQLEVYRQAVLKAAFEGKLTREWREKNSLKIKNWDRVRLDEISNATGGYAFKSKDFREEGKYQVIRIGNIRQGEIRYEASPVFIENVEEKIFEKYKLNLYDILISLTGTRNKRDYGYTALVGSKNLLLNQRVASIRFNNRCKSKYFLYYSWTNEFKNQFFASETGNVGQGNVGMKSIRNTTISLPTIEEQEEIIKEIEARLSVCENIEATIEEALGKSEALRQSILKKAFEGKLLSNEELKACRGESDWKPAEELLKRIKEDKKGVKSNG